MNKPWQLWREMNSTGTLILLMSVSPGQQVTFIKKKKKKNPIFRFSILADILLNESRQRIYKIRAELDKSHYARISSIYILYVGSAYLKVMNIISVLQLTACRQKDYFKIHCSSVNISHNPLQIKQWFVTIKYYLLLHIHFQKNTCLYHTRLLILFF